MTEAVKSEAISVGRLFLFSEKVPRSALQHSLRHSLYPMPKPRPLAWSGARSDVQVATNDAKSDVTDRMHWYRCGSPNTDSCFITAGVVCSHVRVLGDI